MEKKKIRETAIYNRRGNTKDLSKLRYSEGIIDKFLIQEGTKFL
jgi:hypothetical protein